MAFVVGLLGILQILAGAALWLSPAPGAMLTAGVTFGLGVVALGLTVVINRIDELIIVQRRTTIAIEK